ncbi:MAG: cell wall hydrolase, partial [bacterium]
MLKKPKTTVITSKYKIPDVMYKTIFLESSIESIKGQYAVYSVILNRKNSKHFPNTKTEVCLQN